MRPGTARRRRLLDWLEHRAGIELIAALAVAAVGICVFTAFTVVISRNAAPTALDRAILDVARDIKTTLGVDVAKALTLLGTLPAAAVVVAIGAGVLSSRGRVRELILLLLAFGLLVATVQIVKAATDRPRPPHGLAGVVGSAFPSGHSAYSTVYVAVALVATSAISRVSRRVALVLGGVALAVVIGLTRLYLQVHWWSDVVAGWALGAAIFGLFAAVGLVVARVRDNGAPHPRRTNARGAAT